jgi:hypothetical protein
MRLIVLTFFFTALGFTRVFSQTINDLPIKDISVEYIEIRGTPKNLSSNMDIEIDFGQENKAFTNKDTRIKDENGEYLTFHSMIDALTFMGKYGYEFVTVYTIATTNYTVSHYILKKKK